MANHGLTATDLANLLNNDDFKSATRSELLRAKKLGPRAGYVFRTEDMITSLAEELYRRLMDPDATLQEFVKGFVSLARTVGMDELPDAKAPQASSTVNLQINVPRFENPKLRYLESKDSGV
jgi:hypothetical protein